MMISPLGLWGRNLSEEELFFAVREVTILTHVNEMVI
jgi:hypothetical protein